jgi:hypothetical protein
LRGQKIPKRESCTAARSEKGNKKTLKNTKSGEEGELSPPWGPIQEGSCAVCEAARNSRLSFSDGRLPDRRTDETGQG